MRCWVYATIDVDSKLLLGVWISRWRGGSPASAFLRKLKQRHDLAKAEFLTDAMGYRTALFETGLSGQTEYRQRNLIEKWFQTLKMRLKRFHTTWMGSNASAQCWLVAFVYIRSRLTRKRSKNTSR